MKKKKNINTTETHQNTIGTRIKAVRNYHKLKQAEMAAVINVHLQTFSRYERGLLMPSVEVISLIVEKFNVNPQWLLSAEGEMLKDDSTFKDKSLNFSADDPRILIIVEWLRANPEDIDSFLKLIKSMSGINEAAQNLKKRLL